MDLENHFIKILITQFLWFLVIILSIQLELFYKLLYFPIPMLLALNYIYINILKSYLYNKSLNSCIIQFQFILYFFAPILMEIQTDSDAAPNQDSNKQQSDNDIDLTDIIKIPVKQTQNFIFISNQQKQIQIQQRQGKIVQTYGQNLPYIKTKSSLKYEISFTNKQPKEYKSFLKRSESEILQVFQKLRATIKQKQLIKFIKDKSNNQIMVVRIIQTNQKNNFQAKIQDQTGEAYLNVAHGFFWVGMIAVIRVEWQMDNYLLKQVIQQFIQKPPQKNLSLNQNSPCHRITVAKGPFTATQSDEMTYFSLDLLVKEAQKNGSSTLILMGPFISKTNKKVKQGTCQKQYEVILRRLIKQVNLKLPNIKLIMIPSTTDVFHPYPLPQPKINLQGQKVSFYQNPATININDQQKRLQSKINIINTDFIGYIQKNKVGKVSSQLIQKICQQYLKQKMILTGCNLGQNLDESNYLNLYNEGKFGEIIIYGSYQKRANVRKIYNNLFINVGSILFDENEKMGLGYFAQITIYNANENLLCDKTRIDIKKINY